MVRSILLCLVLATAPMPARALCLLGCNTTLDGADAHRAVTETLGLDLPATARVTHVLQGGFQDRFVQIRIGVPARDRDAVLSALSVDASGLAPSGSFGATRAPWWDMAATADLRTATGTLAGYAVTRVAVGTDPADPDRVLIYVFAHAT